MAEAFFPKKPGRTVLHKVDLTGDYETTIYDVARRLLSEGANSRDRVETYRDRVISMAGTIGWLAQWRVVFADEGPCLKRYSGPTLGALADKSASSGVEVAIVGGNGLITHETEHS